MSAKPPSGVTWQFGFIGAGDGIRTRDQELGKLLLYQLSYARLMQTTAYVLR